MTKPTTTATTARRNPFLGIKNTAVGGGTVNFKPRPLSAYARSVFRLMSERQLRTIARLASSPDIPMHVPMGERTLLHGSSRQYLQIEGLCEVASLGQLGVREELRHDVLFEVAHVHQPYMPGMETAKDIADISPDYKHDPNEILAVIRAYEKRQHAALPQQDQEPVTALQRAIAKGLKHATEEATFASLCGLTATGSMSTRRQSIATVDPDNVLPWDRPSIGGEPTETEMTEARAWVLAHAAAAE